MSFNAKTLPTRHHIVSEDDDDDDDERQESSQNDSQTSRVTGTTSSSSLEELTRGDYLILAAKLGVFLTLVASTLVVSLTIYFGVQTQEENQFQGDYNVLADELSRIATFKIQDLYREMDEIAISTTSLAEAQGHTQTWPHVTLRYFGQLAKVFRDISHAKILILSPTITDVDAWEEYAAAHRENWLGQEEESATTSVSLHTANGDAIQRDANAVFNPVWEISPVPTETTNFLYNLDLRSVPEFDHAIAAVTEAALHTTTVVSETITNLAERLQVNSLPDVTNDHPHSLAIHPIVESLKGSASSNVVGYFVSILTWESFLGDILHDQDTLTAVVDNTCGEAFTYKVVGPNVHYEGLGDLHDRKYSEYEVAVPFVNAGVEAAQAIERQRQLEGADATGHGTRICVFTLHIYPTDTFHDGFITRTPLFLAISTVAVFLMTATAFFLWDWNNRLRQKALSRRVKKTSNIITTMFPKNIRDELLRNATSNSTRQLNAPINEVSFDANSHNSKKNRFSDFMDEGLDESLVIQTSKPLADLYVATTIMFADICGFTAWSSVREPTHVFQLLEAIFSSFDDIARKMGVFKVETVGDCYVAVAGMPEARDDHAVLMARFAQRCQRKVDEIMEILVLNLGPDTAELSLRCGLHSGPVTAGVLRGDRARLQLFGDTMNTTSRIETSGAPKKIHVSPDTAQLLEQHKKGHWLERRQDLVVAKGKGAIQTYWLKIHPPAAGEEGSSKPEQAPAPKEDPQTKKMNHLLDWNSEILIKIVKQIVYRRQQKSNAAWNLAIHAPSSLRMAERKMAKESSDVIGEIAEIIPMSDRKIDETTDAEFNAVELDPVVEKQIRNLVSIISKMYRDNPFHCFEHASHVTMAVTKLLSRIHKSVGERDQTYGITADPLTQFALVVAALIHDVDHRGIPNGALKLEDPNLSAAYRHQSVAEQNSVDLAWNVIMDSSFVSLRSCLLENEEDLRRLRQLIVNSVMATDIFDKDLGALRKKRWTDAFHNSDDFVLKNESAQTQLHRKATIVIEHLIQASDVSHTMQHWHIYQKWNERLFAENYQSFQQGRTDKDPSPSWYKGELWFFDNYVIPLTKKLKECGVFGVSSDEYLNYATNNRNEWEKKGEGIVEKFLRKYKKDDDNAE